MTADLILTNARVLTMDTGHPRAEALALAGGLILAVGTQAQIEALAGPDTQVIDAKGRTVLPGFVESHLHLVLGGAELGHLHVSGLHGMEALRDAFQRFGERHPDRPLLMAQGADYAMLDHPVTRHDLDAIVPDRPIAMTAHDHHTVWANTAALRVAGILHGLDTPHGHEVVMGSDGTATGELREFEAFAPVIALGGEARLNLGIATGEEPSPWPDAAERAIDKAKIAAGLRHCAAQGVTSMVNMDGNRYTLELLREMQAEGQLTARVKVPFHFKPHMDLSELDRAEAMTRDFNDDWLQCGFVKMFMDGVVDSRTAFMVNDYPDQPGHRSEPLFAPDRFKEIATEIDRRGLQIAVHAIGDGAVRCTIDGYAAAQAANGRRDSRHRIEHIELIAPTDIPRLGTLGITASLQPPHPPGAMDFPLMPTLERIGQARWKDAYLWKTLADHGAPLAFASDWPVTDVSVMRGLQAALTRQPYDGCADERVGLMATLHAYTAGGAWAAHRDALTGRLAPGMAADVVMIDGDLEATAPDALGATAIALTICGGRITYQAE
ncbi:MAG: amidohydrolase [Pseudotabrizicola sp.]|uniref:amidohydrolase n=1 Tax=Pseudotabrizicola sp. TaxID=2939647 RepID=UPI002720910C|nr:amidohydrolase [Pseudotabrizicola sp.]MDO8883462.1 amidohydrolase [Pseudotabrizicola sp.]MDP2082526.1 amidohydrolase [Pseudotabrizicola sp.]MDZ7573963.1 amidohydrolase [Pseudotabrizicola sp.]